MGLGKTQGDSGVIHIRKCTGLEPVCVVGDGKKYGIYLTEEVHEYKRTHQPVLDLKTEQNPTRWRPNSELVDMVSQIQSSQRIIHSKLDRLIALWTDPADSSNKPTPKLVGSV